MATGDLALNGAYSTVATAPSPATSGTTLTVLAGQGALFPTPPFNATVWPIAASPLTTNFEIVRCTSISTDTLTITRGATSGAGLNGEPNNANRAIVVGDQIQVGPTAGLLSGILGSTGTNLATNTTVTTGGVTLATTPSLAIGSYLCLGLITFSTNATYASYGQTIITTGSATASFAGPSVSNDTPGINSQSSGTASCIATVTVAGTLILKGVAGSATGTLSAVGGFNATGIVTVRIQ